MLMDTTTLVPVKRPTGMVPPNIATEWVYLTPERAEAYLARNRNNRAMAQGTVTKYARAMRNGYWHAVSDTIKFDTNGNMLDGQHRCAACVESGTAIWVLVAHGLDPESRPAIDAGRPRAAADTLRWAGVEHYYHQIPPIARIAMARETGVLRNSLSRAKADMTNDEVLAWYLDNPDVEDAAAIAGAAAKAIEMRPGPVGYCTLLIRRIDPEATEEFLNSMPGNIDGGDRDARRVLMTYLRNARSQRRVLQEATQVYLLLKTWNLWRQGAQVKNIPIAGAASRQSGSRVGSVGLAIPNPI